MAVVVMEDGYRHARDYAGHRNHHASHTRPRAFAECPLPLGGQGQSDQEATQMRHGRLLLGIEGHADRLGRRDLPSIVVCEDESQTRPRQLSRESEGCVRWHSGRWRSAG